MNKRPTQHPMNHVRRAFFDREGVTEGKVPDIILRSWHRCREWGLAERSAPAMEPVSHVRLREMRDRHESLWRLARAEIEQIAADAATIGSIVILTDQDGWILDAEGSPGFLDKAGRVALMPGVCWNERQVGTNAIGTAIVEARSVEVRGSEHYFAPHRILSCTASPIFDPYGQLVGVLDISGDSAVPHMHALGLARLAVANIEHRYFEEGIADCELLRLHRDPALVGTAREGLLAFRKGKLAAANQAGLLLFGLDRKELGRASYESLFDAPISRMHDDGILLDRHGRVLHGSLGGTVSRRVHTNGRKPVITVSAATSIDAADAPLIDASTNNELERARRVLDAGLPVLVLGETGTGKEVFARELHRRSARSGKPFVAVNCAALPEGLIEAELFGYEEGAFTGARKHGNQGLLRQANGGVLFLDEIGDMPLALQPRLLRVLQDRELFPLGGGKSIKLDFALVCATHQNLEQGVSEGRFRADLYYRVAHHCVRMPSLRDHAELALVVRGLWQRIGQGREISAEVQQRLASYTWPGNLRQLNACLRTLVALSESDACLGVESLPSYLQGLAGMEKIYARVEHSSSGAVLSDGESLDVVAETAMRAALAANHGNVAGAARQLGVSRSTLYRRLGKPKR